MHALGFRKASSQGELSSTHSEHLVPKLNCLPNVAEMMSKAAKLIVEGSISFDYINYPRYFKDDVLSILFTEASAILNFKERTNAIIKNARRLLPSGEQSSGVDTKLPRAFLSIQQKMLDKEESRIAD